MRKILSNNDGVSIFEIVATVAIVSICLIMIFNVLNFNIRQNGINQEKTINANIASAALNYIKTQDFTLIDEYLADANYAVINNEQCSSLLIDDPICTSALSPTINNKKYDNTNLNIYILPYNDYEKLALIQSTPPNDFPDILIDHIQEIDLSKFYSVETNPNAIRIIVVVHSPLGSKYDFLLEGVTTSE